jgi:iron complex outermembrane receptor protein
MSYLSRAFRGLLALGAVAILTGMAWAADAATRAFDIPAGEAATTLRAFAQQAQREIVFPPMEGVRTNAVKGDFTAKAALDRMIAGTDLIAFEDVKSGALIVNRPPAEAKNVLSRPADAAVANGATARSANSATKRDDGTVKLQEFEVTGSRIRSLVDSSDINPVFSFTRSDIEHAGVTSVGELSRLIPQAYSQGSYDGIGFGGQSGGLMTTSDGSSASATATARSTFNLRGLGGQNTLVMINGRRVTKTGVIRGQDASDLAGIPVSSIERVEVLLGGASAIYGSDAVGGVINIILRRNYTGGELALSYENTFASDTAVRTATLSYGITRDKLELQLSATVQDRNAFAAVDRRFSATDDWITLGGTSGFATGTDSFAFGGFATGAGVVAYYGDNLPGRTSPYALIPDNAGAAPLPASAYVSVDGDDLGVPAYTGDRAKYVNLISPQQNSSASLRANYRLTENHDLYLEGRYSQTKTRIEGMPVNYRNSIFAVPADYPGNPFGVELDLYKTFWELGPIQGQKTALTSNTALAAGLRGNLPFSDWRYDAGFDWNRAYLEDKDAYNPALDSTVFNSLIDAQSLVLFYDSRTQSPNDLNVLRSLLQNGAKSERNTNGTFSASADGSIWELPAGSIRLAVGGEYRAERARTTQAVAENPRINQSLIGNFQRDAQAAFAETRVPLVSEKQHLPWLHSLELSAAARYDSYDDTGSDVSPGYGLIWRPVKWVILRASRNHAFRVPSLNDLYRPLTAGRLTFFDRSSSPVDPQRGNTPLPPGVYATTLGGNLSLKPEQSISDNFGLVIESPFERLKGLSFSADYQVIDYTDRITGFGSAQEIFDLFPERITRGANLPGDLPGWAGIPTRIDTRAANIAKLEIQAIDYQLSYRRMTSWGAFDARVTMTDYLKYLATAIPGAAPTSTLNQFPTRLSWQTYWTKGPWGFGVSGFYQEKQYRNLSYTAVRFHSALEWNTQIAYDFDRRSGGGTPNDTRLKRWLLSGTKIAFNVSNVFNREPPHIEGQAGFAVTDPRMARYVITLRKGF